MGSVLRICEAVVFLVACLVYCNSLHGDFAFDDYSAIVNNKDVTDWEAPISNLLGNDFWGQDVTSEKSHKSYRPLTVLVFRAIAYFARDGIDHVEADDEDEDDEDVIIVNMESFLFHAVNVVLHGVVSVLVLRCGEIEQDKNSMYIWMMYGLHFHWWL